MYLVEQHGTGMRFLKTIAWLTVAASVSALAAFLLGLAQRLA